MNFCEKFRINFCKIYSLTIIISGTIFSIITFLSSIWSWDDIKIFDFWLKVIIILGICIGSFMIAFILVIFILKSKKIWSQGRNKVLAMYSDLFLLGFNKKNKKNKIIVIPVNDTFETIVERAGETVTKALVSPNTIHGKWITYYCESNDITPEDLNNRIHNNLKIQGYIPVKTYTLEEKNRGNRDSYELGTVAIIDGLYNVKFYLIAISKFDSNNNAQSNKKEIRDAVDDLIDFYDKNGQADPIYLPLMGTGSSRANLSHELSFKVIKTCILTSTKKINGEMNIIVYTGDRHKVSIFK